MEQQVRFESEGEEVHGMLHAVPGARWGTVFLGGWSGDRLGPHRMFVKAARRLHGDGIASLRFDFRGRGDSQGLASTAAIETMANDASAAIEFMLHATNVERVLLIGICSGGKVAIEAATRNPSVTRLVLWSAEAMGSLAEPVTEVRKATSSLRQYMAKALSPGTWRKFLAGNVNFRQVRKAILPSERVGASERERESAVLETFRKWPHSLLFIYGGNDPTTASAATAYAGFCDEAGIPATFHKIEGANHSFYSLAWENEVLGITQDWLLPIHE